MAFANVAIFGKLRAENIREPLTAIARLVESIGARVLFDQATCESVGVDGYACHSVHAIGKQADVAVVLGGDGTMLGIARELSPFKVPLIGINHGRLGFITDIALDHMAETLLPMLRGAYETDRRILLDAEVRRGGRVAFHAAALNDVVVSRGVTGGMVEYTAARSCIRHWPGCCWFRSPRRRCRTGRSCCRTMSSSRSRSPTCATRARTSICSRTSRCRQATSCASAAAAKR
jgi:hypothetical protein